MADYIYILENDRMPGLLKIGWTSRTPEERCAELSNATGVPTCFTVAHKVEVSSGREAEREIHVVLREYRYSQNREFFHISLERARNAVDFVCPDFEPTVEQKIESTLSKARNLAKAGKTEDAIGLLIYEEDMKRSEAQGLVLGILKTASDDEGERKYISKLTEYEECAQRSNWHCFATSSKSRKRQTYRIISVISAVCFAICAIPQFVSGSNARTDIESEAMIGVAIVMTILSLLSLVVPSAIANQDITTKGYREFKCSNCRKYIVIDDSVRNGETTTCRNCGVKIMIPKNTYKVKEFTFQVYSCIPPK